MTSSLALLLILLQGPRISPEALESKVFDLVNAERVDHKLKPLKADPRLTGVARAHSRDMAKRGFFDHVNPDGQSPSDRGRKAGVPCRRQYADYSTAGISENIFQNNLYDRVIFKNDQPTYEWKTLEEIAVSTVMGWMNSPGHRKAILTSTFTTTGIGVAIATNDQVLITQEFC
jgi:uncharacterized protein YkwD